MLDYDSVAHHQSCSTLRRYPECILVRADPRGGTEGLAGYDNYGFHFRGFLIGIVISLLISLILAVVVPALF